MNSVGGVIGTKHHQSLLTDHLSLLTAALAAERCAVGGIAALATSWPPMKTGFASMGWQDSRANQPDQQI